MARRKSGKWIQKAIKRPGAFTAKARRRGVTPAKLQQRVLANPERYDATTVRQARLRKTLVGKKVKGRRRKRKR